MPNRGGPGRAGIAAPTPKQAAAGGISAVFAAIIAATLVHEGGYVNHKDDRGGETNWGITEKVARQNAYHGPMRTLPKDVAISIYYKDYVVAPGFQPLEHIDAAVTEELYDTGVNMGPRYPSRWFQNGINALCNTRIAPDGRVGPQTINAYAACQRTVGAAQLCVDMLNYLDIQQKARYLAIVRARPSQKVFLKGWLRVRINNVDRRKCMVRR